MKFIIPSVESAFTPKPEIASAYPAKTEIVREVMSIKALKPIHPLACGVLGCKKYNKPFANAHALAAHVRAVHHQHSMQTQSIPPNGSATTPPFHCKHPGCKRTFPTIGGANLHFYRAHQPHQVPAVKCSPDHPFACRICGKTLPNKKAVSNHGYNIHKLCMSKVIQPNPDYTKPDSTPRKMSSIPDAPQFRAVAKNENGEIATTGSLDFVLHSARTLLTSGFTRLQIGVAE